VGFLVFFCLFQTLVASGQRGGETFFSNPWLALSILIAAAFAIAAGVVAAIAIFWKHERSFFTFVALILGLLVAIFVLGEIIVPH
jgi:cytochrome bd-type quinol oxidase subunit 2